MPIDSSIARLFTNLHFGERTFLRSHNDMASLKALTASSLLTEDVANVPAV